MSFSTLALLVAVGLAGPLLAALPRFAAPLVVGEIAAGVIIGRSGFDLVQVNDPTLNLLSETGFALLMLIVGTHLPFRQPALRPALGKAALAAGLSGVLAVGAGFALAPVSGLHHPAILAVLIATSSGAVALPVLQAIPARAAGDTSLLVTTAWIAIADVATVLSIPLVIRQGSISSILLGIAMIAVLSGGVYLLAKDNRRERFIKQVRKRSKNGHWALDLRLSLVILFALAAIAVRQHTSVLIAGFAAGTVLALLGEPRRLAQQLIGLGEGFLVPIFFVTLGAKLQLGSMFSQPRNLVLAAVIAVGATAVHVVVALVLRLPVGSGLLATAQLGVPSAVASIGLSTGVLAAGQGAAILAAALLSLLACSVGASLFGHHDPIGDHTAPAIAPTPPAGATSPEGSVTTPAETGVTPPQVATPAPGIPPAPGLTPQPEP